MPSPFPGMNPYLEHPALWSGIHHRVITAIANDSAPQIRPKYIDYTCDPIPALSATDTAWLNNCCINKV